VNFLACIINHHQLIAHADLMRVFTQAAQVLFDMVAGTAINLWSD
jgi:hypothetical protein